MAYRTILLKGDLNQIVDEAKAGEAGIYPGMLLKWYTNAGEVRKHAIAGGTAAPIFAKENDLAGDEVADAYTSGERCQILRCRVGDIIAAMIEQGENIQEGDYLESTGTGTLRKCDELSAGDTHYPRGVVAVALEAIDLSTSALSDTLARVQIV